MKARRSLAGMALAAVGAAAMLLALTPAEVVAASAADRQRVEVGEARRGSVTVALGAPIRDIAISGPAGRPIVLIDPGHGGRDPGAAGISGSVREKELTLALARALRDELVARGRVRVAMTRDDDRTLSLDERAAMAGRIGASLFISLHMDAAPNPLARGASIYSQADVASDADAARFAEAENRAGHTRGRDSDGTVRAMLSDLVLREQMITSAELAERIIRKAAGRVMLRPDPHRHAAFHLLRQSTATAILFEAGYISNADDELLLSSGEYRAELAKALAEGIEADVIARARR